MNKLHKQIQWQNYVWISKVIFSTRFPPTILVTLAHCGFSLKWKIHFHQDSQDLKQSLNQQHKQAEKISNMCRIMKINKMKTISQKGFIFTYSNLRDKMKSNILTFKNSVHVSVLLDRIAKLKFWKHLSTINTGWHKLQG